MANVILGWLQRQRLLPALLLFGLVLIILLLLSKATENSARFSQSYSSLLLASAIGLLLLMVLIGFSLRRLWLRFRQREPGSRLTFRLVLIFVAISAAPVAVVYYFSMQFLLRGIDSWFDVRVEHALEDALDLSRLSLDLRMREVVKETEQMADDLFIQDEDSAAIRLTELLNRSDATELTLFAQSGRIIATASRDPTVIIPSHPPEAALLAINQRNTYVGLDPIRNSGFYIRVLAQINSADESRDSAIMQALFHVPERLSELADSVRSAFDEYKELAFLRGPLKTSFILSLSLVLLFGILSALWAALYSARRLVLPIRDLAEGTRAVAAGDYNQQLPRLHNDELGFLVHSFNQMTRKLARARDDAEHSQQLIEQQRTFLEAVLTRLSSGVLTLDSAGVLYTFNNAAEQILAADLANCSENDQPPHLQQFFETIKPYLEVTANPALNHHDWREEVTLFSHQGRQVLLCRGSSLPDSVGLQGGHVIVFDDITTLVQAQRDAAWTEVARRLAHEIKNPLTPIQLAADRLRHKLLPNMAAESASILDRSTHTIIQQVQAMKDMVNAFNEYARPPQLRLTTLLLNDFINDVIYLYKDFPSDVSIKTQLDPNNPCIEADRGRLRQLLHNLIKNAIEAMASQQLANHSNTLVIYTRHRQDHGRNYVELGFEDDGPGFPETDLGDVFEPYVTTKTKGTGLGLAIVKKIVEEHGGLIKLANRPQGESGARVVIQFPSSDASPLPTHTDPVIVEQEAG